MTIKELINLSDYDLIDDIQRTGSNDSLYALYSKYQFLIYKHWRALYNSMLSTPLLRFYSKSEIQENFLDGVYEGAFLKAVKYINLDKVIDDNWKFIGIFAWLLTSYRKIFLKKLLGKKNVMAINLLTWDCSDQEMETPSDGSFIFEKDLIKNDIAHLSAEDTFFREDKKDLINRGIENCKKKWSPVENDIFIRMYEKTPVADIARELNLEKMYTIQTVKKLRRELEREFKRILKD